MGMTIITNNVPRDVIYGHELTAEEREQFDYIDWPAVERGEASAEFFRYKGELYDLNDGFERTSSVLSPDLGQWDGYQSDSFFSGLVIRYPHDPDTRIVDFERVIVGRYCV